jgi:hypothetical protein
MARRVVWFSCGAASAVAAKMAVEKYGSAVDVIYCDTMSAEHPDNARFFADVERWLGRPITKIKSGKYADLDEVFERTRYMAGIAGARCTTELKKLPRESFQRPDDIHLFGYTVEEKDRAEDFERNNPALDVEWILIENGVNKRDCLRALSDAQITLPVMYSIGFDHNNCLGCVKATSPTYWNRVRKLFPKVFERRARQSRLIGARLVRVNNERIFLDELDPDAQGDLFEAIDCGPVCQTPKTKEENR